MSRTYPSPAQERSITTTYRAAGALTRHLPRSHRLPRLRGHLPADWEGDRGGRFMIVSNIYATVGYIFHERVWARIRWGIERVPAVSEVGGAKRSAVE